MFSMFVHNPKCSLQLPERLDAEAAAPRSTDASGNVLLPDLKRRSHPAPSENSEWL